MQPCNFDPREWKGHIDKESKAASVANKSRPDSELTRTHHKQLSAGPHVHPPAPYLRL